MKTDFPFLIYYLGLAIVTIFCSRFIFSKYIQFAKTYNLTNSLERNLGQKSNILTGGGVVFASVLMVAALVLENLDFVEFSNFSPVLATSILIAVVGFYNDFINISLFNKFIILIFLILMLLYSNATLPIIKNFNGFLGINSIGSISGLIFTSFIYIFIMSAINMYDVIDGYIAIFSIFFFTSLLYNFDVNKFYTLNSVSVILIASSITYLTYNFSKVKKLFLGNAGSLFIGFWIATYLITYVTSAPNSELVQVYSIDIENIPVIAISMISIPVLDTLRVMLVRILNQKSPFAADRNHLHHILLDSGMTHFRVSLFLTVINWFNCIAIFLIEQNFNSKELTLIYIIINLFWYGFFEYINRKNLSSSKG